MTFSVAEVHHLKHADANEEILPAMITRWSPRSFSNRQINPADLRKIFEAARWAPSSFNEQPWRFIVGLKGTETFERIASVLGGFNQQWAPKAQVLILGAAKTRFSHNGSPNGYAFHDLGAAAGFITLQAAELGLATHQMAGFDQEGARKAFGIPEEYAIGSVMALGYPGEPSELPPGLAAQETAPRTRKPLSEIVFSAWGEPANLR
jgi:nitroreductase